MTEFDEPRTVYIRIKKSMRIEVAEKHPNLAQSPVYLPIQTLKANKNLNKIDVRPEDIGNYIQKHIETNGLKTYPDKYPFDEKEEADIVWKESDQVVWEGDLKTPQQYQGEDPETVEVFG